MPEEIGRNSDAWNVAQGWTQLKILKPSVETDKLVRMAIYGSESIEESLQMSSQEKTNVRIEAIKWLIDILKETIENSKFACDKDKETVVKLKNDIDEVVNVLDAICTVKTDQRTRAEVVTINEKHFKICLEELRRIKTELPVVLNNNNLIFPASEDFDFEKIKDDFQNGV